MVPIGPRAQELLKQFFVTDIDAYLFSPVRALEERNAERAANRKTPRYPSHMKRNATKRKAKPEHKPAEKYNCGSYELAINRACDRAFVPYGDLAKREDETHGAWWGQKIDGNWTEGRLTADQRAEVKKWRKNHRWSPNRLRHSFATKVRRQHGLEVTQVLLGHSKADTTQLYAQRNETLAAEVAAIIG
jgi:hypothetical protein